MRGIVRWLLWRLSGTLRAFNLAPADRQYIIDAESRVMTVAAEDRQLIVEG